MIHDASSESGHVPEELYNLTQLADVTLAAGKLATTNVHKIKEFIKIDERTPAHDDDDDDNEDDKPHGLLLLKCIDTMTNTKQMDASPKLSSDGGYISDLECNEKQKTSLQQTSANEKQNIDTDVVMLEVSKIPAKSQTLADQRQISFSSSEDDSTYSYSHKIFDKRKSRKLQAQYDEADRIASKADMSGKMNGINAETEDSMLSISEAECADDDAKHKSMGNRSIAMAEGLSDVGDLDGKNASEMDTTMKMSDDVHTCPECGKKYSTSSNLARHRQTHRSLHDKKARRCPHCDKVYVSSPAYSMHVRTHNQGCECPHCGKRFSRPWLLQGHIRTHTGEKPFQCSICTKSFADKSNLRAHIQTHSNTKPHTCGRCGKAFALKSYLYKHEESSCMRNHSKSDKVKHKHTAAATKPELIRTKSTKPRPNDSSTSPTLRKPKEKHTNDVTSSVDCFITAPTSISSECIYLDVGSKKSYIDLSDAKASNEPYSRISVIRTIGSQSSSPSAKPNDEFQFYQEKPVDFSPKHKYKSDFMNATGKTIPITETSLQYCTTMVV